MRNGIKWNALDVAPFHWEMTLLGGQSFGWDLDDGVFYGATQKCVIALKPQNDKLYWQTFPQPDDGDYVSSYLRLNENFDSILKTMPVDPHIQKAVGQFPHLRLLKQDFEEAVLSYLISQNNSIPSIRTRVRHLTRAFGRNIKLPDREIHLFPETSAIASATLEELLACKLGFRAKYLKKTAASLGETKLSQTIHSLSDEVARDELKKLSGVGDKIADCVLLYGLGRDSVTPFDIWGQRILKQMYRKRNVTSHDDMRVWTRNYFGPYAGWAWQWLFEMIRQ